MPQASGGMRPCCAAALSRRAPKRFSADRDAAAGRLLRINGFPFTTQLRSLKKLIAEWAYILLFHPQWMPQPNLLASCLPDWAHAFARCVVRRVGRSNN